MALLATSRSGKRRRCTSSLFKVAMKLSAIALCPGRSRSFPSRGRCRPPQGACQTRSPCTGRPAVGMMNESGGWLAPPYRHLQRIDHELRPRVVLHRPPDYPSRMGVQDEGQVKKALPHRYVSDVRQPDHVGLTGHEVPAKQVRGGSSQRIAAGGSTLFAPHTASESRNSHQSSYPPAAAPY